MSGQLTYISLRQSEFRNNYYSIKWARKAWESRLARWRRWVIQQVLRFLAAEVPVSRMQPTFHWGTVGKRLPNMRFLRAWTHPHFAHWSLLSRISTYSSPPSGYQSLHVFILLLYLFSHLQLASLSFIKINVLRHLGRFSTTGWDYFSYQITTNGTK